MTCVDMAGKRRAFERALRGSIGAGVVEDLRRALGGTAEPTGREGSESPAS
jgi:hypothetical protein